MPRKQAEIEIEYHTHDSGFHASLKTEKYSSKVLQFEQSLDNAGLKDVVRVVKNPGPAHGLSLVPYQDALFASRGDFSGPRIRYPRIGAFEVTLRSPGSAGVGNIKLWSKLESKLWPNCQKLAADVAALLDAAANGQATEVSQLVSSIQERQKRRPSSAPPGGRSFIEEQQQGNSTWGSSGAAHRSSLSGSLTPRKASGLRNGGPGHGPMKFGLRKHPLGPWDEAWGWWLKDLRRLPISRAQPGPLFLPPPREERTMPRSKIPATAMRGPGGEGRGGLERVDWEGGGLEGGGLEGGDLKAGGQEGARAEGARGGSTGQGNGGDGQGHGAQKGEADVMEEHSHPASASQPEAVPLSRLSLRSAGLVAEGCEGPGGEGRGGLERADWEGGGLEGGGVEGGDLKGGGQEGARAEGARGGSRGQGNGGDRQGHGARKGEADVMEEHSHPASASQPEAVPLSSLSLRSAGLVAEGSEGATDRRKASQDEEEEEEEAWLRLLEEDGVTDTASLTETQAHLFSRLKKTGKKTGMGSERFNDYLKHLQKLLAREPCTIDLTELRGITIQQLQQVEQLVVDLHSQWGWRDRKTKKNVTVESANLYAINEFLLKPATCRDDRAWVEMVAEGEQPPDWFCSHWWGEALQAFLERLIMHEKARTTPEKPSELNYWICAYANRQHSLGNDIAADPSQTSFFKALMIARGVLVVLDSEATPFRRLWCAFEIHTALTNERDGAPLLLDFCTHNHAIDAPAILTDGLTDAEAAASKNGEELVAKLQSYRHMIFPIQVLGEGVKAELHKADCSVQADRHRILNHIAGNQLLDTQPAEHHDNYDKVNILLGGRMARVAWKLATQQGLLHRLGFVEAMMKSDAACRELIIDEKIIDFASNTLEADLAELIKTVAPKIESLQMPRLSFQQAQGIVTDKTLAALVVNLPPQDRLQHLHLNFKSCEQITDAGLAALACKIPQEGLLHLYLNFKRCEQLTDGGLAALAANLPKDHLQHLQLDFTFCKQITDAGVAAFACKIPQEGLLHLHLDFAKCELEDGGLAALAAKLPKDRLQHLHLDFGSCKKLTDAGVAALACKIPQEGLLHLYLIFEGCEQLTDAAVAALAAKLPKDSLEELFLDFEDCHTMKRGVEQGEWFGLQDMPDLAEWAKKRLKENEAGPAGPAEPAALPAEPFAPPEEMQASAEAAGRRLLSTAADASACATDAHGTKEKDQQLLDVNLTDFELDGDAHMRALAFLVLNYAGAIRALRLRVRRSGIESFMSLWESVTIPFMQELDLELDCHATDATVASLASKLPETLIHLELNLGNDLTNTAVASLAAGLAKASLDHLNLDFIWCTKLTDEAVSSLAAALPKDSLRHLFLRFAGCGQLTDRAVTTLAANVPKGSLCHLGLDFYQCEHLTDGGVATLAANLPKDGSLRQLALVFGHCRQLTDRAVATLAANVPWGSLRHLALNFYQCGYLTDGGVATLAANIPKDGSLRHLALHFGDCIQLTDRAVATLAANLPKDSLEELYLNFEYCFKVSKKNYDNWSIFELQHMPDLVSWAILWLKDNERGPASRAAPAALPAEPFAPPEEMQAAAAITPAAPPAAAAAAIAEPEATSDMPPP